MRIEVPMLPPKECSPNWRAHHINQYKAGKIYQQAVFMCAVDTRNKFYRVPWRPGFPPFKKPKLSLTFIFPVERERDEDNLLARFKPGQDALVQADLLTKDSIGSFIRGQVDVKVDPRRAPMTIIELEETA